MRIFNGTKKQLDLPLMGNEERLTIKSFSASKEFMPSEELISLIVTSFDTNEIALIISGPFEVSLCSRFSGAVALVVNSLEEALIRFGITKTEEPKNPEPPVTKEIKDIEIPVAPEPEPIVTPENPIITFPTEVVEETVQAKSEESSNSETSEENTSSVEETPVLKVKRRKVVKKLTSDTPTTDEESK